VTPGSRVSPPYLLPRRVRRPLLSHGLILRESQSHPLGHFYIPFGAIFDARRLVFVEGFGAKGGDARREASFRQRVVHDQTILNLHLLQ